LIQNLTMSSNFKRIFSRLPLKVSVSRKCHHQ